MIRLLVLCVLLIASIHSTQAFVKKAFCRMEKMNTLLGVIHIEEENINGLPCLKLTGQLKLNDFQSGLYGFHIHEKPATVNCKDAGAHYNPHNLTHGDPHNRNRHVGDLGNIQVNSKQSDINIRVENVSLNGNHSVLNRSIVLHVMADDLGATLNPESLKTGNAGPRYACCIITPVS